MDDITQYSLSESLENFYRFWGVKAVLAVPLVTQGVTLGLLVAHHCKSPRRWQKADIRLLEQLAIQVAIAIQQAQLYGQVQTLNGDLEQQVCSRTAELEEKMLELEGLHEMKAVFLQAVSHDLRTSVMGLMMLLRNLHARPGENLTLSRTSLERMLQSGDRQLTLLNALSEDHLADTCSLVLNCQPLSLQNFLHNVLHHWHLLLQQSQVNLCTNFPDDLPLVKADPTYLRQVFDHLLANALKHNPPGIQLNLLVTCEASRVRFSLIDTGIGMEPEQCRHLFRLYLRSVHNPRLTGIGLGSYLCRHIIEAHGGQIGVTSKSGQGSEFWFTLPLA